MDVSLADIIAIHMEQDKNDGIILPEAIIARVARDVLRAMTRIHRLHRIHRDIRSDNILLNVRGEVKLSKCVTNENGIMSYTDTQSNQVISVIVHN